MRKKIILRLLFLTAFMALLWSCHSEDPFQQESPAGSTENLSAAKYASRSLWKEDEVYIDKVQQVFLKHANLERFGITYGELHWDYAMSFGQFGEKYVLVPIVKENKVVLLMEAVREGSKVYFYEKRDEDLLDFFQHSMYSKIIKFDEQISTPENISAKASTYVCSTRTLEVGCDGEPGCVPYVKSVTTCGFQQGGAPPKGLDPSGDPNWGSGGGGEDDGYVYPDPPELNPCEKLKAQNTNSQFTGKIDDLKSKLTLKKETGYVEKTNGSFDYKDNSTATETANSLSLGNPTADMKGYLHTHPNDFEMEYPDGTIEYRKGFKIFSPADVIYFNQMVALANQNGMPLGDIYAVMVSGTGIYQIRFTGNVNQVKTVYTNTKLEYNKMYLKYFQENAKRSDEMNFLKFMDEHMYVKGVSLVKMNDDGTFTTKTLNSDKSGMAESDCPQ